MTKNTDLIDVLRKWNQWIEFRDDVVIGSNQGMNTAMIRVWNGSLFIRYDGRLEEKVKSWDGEAWSSPTNNDVLGFPNRNESCQLTRRNHRLPTSLDSSGSECHRRSLWYYSGLKCNHAIGQEIVDQTSSISSDGRITKGKENNWLSSQMQCLLDCSIAMEFEFRDRQCHEWSYRQRSMQHSIIEQRQCLLPNFTQFSSVITSINVGLKDLQNE